METIKPVPLRPPSSADSTSGYFSSGASYVDDQAGEYSVFIQKISNNIKNGFVITRWFK